MNIFAYGIGTKGRYRTTKNVYYNYFRSLGNNKQKARYLAGTMQKRKRKY